MAKDDKDQPKRLVKVFDSPATWIEVPASLSEKEVKKRVDKYIENVENTLRKNNLILSKFYGRPSKRFRNDKKKSNK